MDSKNIYDFIIKVQAIAKIGLTYSKDPYAITNYNEINELSKRFLEDFQDVNLERNNYEKTAIINRADAQKQQAILHAEGEAQARIRKAEAEAKAIELITEAVGKSTNPANYLLAQKYIQMMQELAQGDKTKTVYLPYEATNLLGSIGGIKDLFKSE